MTLIFKKIDVLLMILVQLLIFFSCLWFLNFDHELHVARNLLLFIFLESILISFIDRPFNIYQVFLAMMFVFNLALPFFESIGIYHYPDAFMIMESDGIEQTVSKESMFTMYTTLIYFLIGSSIGWLLGILSTFDWYRNPRLSLCNKNYHQKFSLIIKIIFSFIFILVMYWSINLVIQTRIHGYVEVMHLHSSSSFIFNIADALYKVTGVLLLFTSTNKRQFIKYACIFLLPYLVQFFTGARGETVAVIFTLIFIYTIIYSSISMRKILFYGALLFFAVVVVGILRFSDDLASDLSGISSFDMIVNPIISSSKSLGVVAYTIELKDYFFNKVPFIFGYIDSIFSFEKNYTTEGVIEKSYLAQHVTYLTNPEKLFRGSTIGSSFVAEVFEFSGGNSIAILVFSSLSLFFARIIPFLMVKNIYLFYLGFVFLEAFVLSPRGSIMKFFNKEFIVSIIFISIIALFISAVKKENRSSKKLNVKTNHPF